MKIVYLRPTSTYRTELRSDTLFGLLMWGIHEIHGDEVVENLIAEFQKCEPPFLISSAMPFSEDNGEILHFFPMPLIPFSKELSQDQMDIYKKFKKLNWLPADIFKQLRSGSLSLFDLFDGLEWEQSKEALYWHNSVIAQPQIKSQTVMHNVIDRLSSSAGGEAGNLFATEEFYVAKGGLYFLMDVLKNEVVDLLNGVFQFYQHIGFGGDASIGKSAFRFSVDDYTEMNAIPDADSVMNLSLYLPQTEELIAYRNNSDSLWYQMEMRKGKVGGKLFVGDNVWKKTVNAFREGSCFPKLPNRKIYGQFPLVKEAVPKPEIPEETFNVHYYGYGLMIDYQQKRDS